MKLLRRLIGRLSDLVEAWEQFSVKDVRYFLDSDFPSSLFLEDSIAIVDSDFTKMKALLSRFKKMETELCNDSPQGVSR